MKIVPLLAVVALSGIAVTTGLQCYFCVYVENMSHSQDDCNSSPHHTNLTTCVRKMSLSDDTNQISNIGNTLLKYIKKSPGNSPKAKGDLVCVKATAKYDGKVVITRGCGEAVVDEDLDGKSENMNDFCEDGVCFSDIKQYYCTKDICNSGVSLSSLSIVVVIALSFLSIYRIFL